MKINVNVYNEILSYEGTPAELAEFMSYGIFDEQLPTEEMLDCGYEDEDEIEEDCNCEESAETHSAEPIDVVIEEAKEKPIVEVHIDDNEPFDAEKHKEDIRKKIRKIYPDLSNKEFDEYYDFIVN